MSDNPSHSPLTCEVLTDTHVEEASGDILGWSSLVSDLAQTIGSATPPNVIGVNGDWGAGKTSFLHLLENKLQKDNSPTLFFEAWRYENEPVPIVALIQEIREHLSWVQKAKRTSRKLGEAAFYGSLSSIDHLTEKIEVSASKVVKATKAAGEAWEKRNYETPLSTKVIRDLLHEAITALLGKGKRLTIIIDDLDRCDHRTAYRLLEGIKIYLNIPSCVFVLGINLREIRRSISVMLKDELPSPEEDAGNILEVRSREYLEKICSYMVALPILNEANEKALLEQWLFYQASHSPDKENCRQTVMNLCSEYSPLLPANPRKIKSFANTFNRLFTRSWNEPSFDPASEYSSDGFKEYASNLLLAAYFKTYLEDISRVLQREPSYLVRIREWAQEEDHSTDSPDRNLADLKRPYLGGKIQGSQASSRPTETTREDSAYLDPAYGNIFFIQRLVMNSTDIDQKRLSQLLSL